MDKVMTSVEFVERLKAIPHNFKTLYVMGCFGAPMTDSNRKRYSNNNEYNKRPARSKLINAASSDTFGFDCVCLIKGVLWGWYGDTEKIYGGAEYKSNGVPDFGTENMLSYCDGVSADFSDILPGEVLYLKGHAGVYIGDGLCVESSPVWEDGVQITAVENIRSRSDYNNRKWTKHGRLRYILYPTEQTVTVELPVLSRGCTGGEVKTAQRLINSIDGKRLVLDGSYGPATEKGVIAYQEKHGLVADGIVGPMTWNSLLK